MVYKSCEMVPLDLIYFNYCTSSCNIIMSYPSSVAGAGANVFGSVTLYPGKGLKINYNFKILLVKLLQAFWPAKLKTFVVW